MIEYMYLGSYRRSARSTAASEAHLFLRPLPRGLLRRPLAVSPLQSEAVANNKQNCGNHQVLVCSKGKHKNSYYNN
jgi:hypothetical protein